MYDIWKTFYLVVVAIVHFSQIENINDKSEMFLGTPDLIIAFAFVVDFLKTGFIKLRQTLDDEGIEYLSTKFLDRLQLII
jgi:hypothetical protein